MPLRSLLISAPETLSDLLLAADDRYRDAEELIIQQRFDGAVYFFGFASEMWLKAACLRLRGGVPNLQVKSALAPLRAFMAATAPQILFKNNHDLIYFAECIVQLRAHVGRPIQGNTVDELRTRAAALHAEWIVDMRYRRSGLVALNAWLVLQHAWWLKTNWPRLT